MSLMETWQFWMGIGAFVVVVLIGVFQIRKQTDSLMKTILGFKYLCIAFALLLFSFGLALPLTGFWALEPKIDVESLLEVSVYQQRLGSDLNRLREVVEWSLRFGVIWLVAMCALVKSLAKELLKNRSGA